MVMADTVSTESPSSSNRLVTVDDLRYELQRERAITDAHFARITSHVDSLERRVTDLSNDMLRRFTEAREHTDRQFQHLNQRFEVIDQRFDWLEGQINSIDERLRYNKTLIVASLSALASVASVVVSLAS